MNEHYEIRVRGYLGPVLRTAVGNVRYRTLPNQVLIQGRLSDDQLDGLLDRLDRCGIELICLSRLRGDSSAGDGVADNRPAQDQPDTV